LTQAPGSTLTAPHRWSIVFLLCVAFVVAYLDRQNLSYALTDPGFNKFFSLSENDRGWLNSAFFWSYTVLQVPAGWLIDKFGVRVPFAACFFLWSIVSGLTAFTTSFGQLFSLRLILGAGEAVNTPAGIRWIRQNFPAHRHGLVMGLYQASAKVGPALGAPLSAWLIHDFGWQNMFMILGFGALLWLLPWLFLVPSGDTTIPESKPVTASLSFGDMMKNRVTWGIIVGSFCYQYFNYFCLLDLPRYFAEKWQMQIMKNGAYTGASYLGFAIIATLSGYLADALIRRGYDLVAVRKGFIVAGLALASTELIGAYATSESTALGFAIFSLSSLGLATGNYWALTPAMLPGAPPGRLAALQNTAANLPGVVVPLVTSYLRKATGGWEAPMIAVFVFLIIGIASYLLLVRKEYAPK